MSRGRRITTSTAPLLQEPFPNLDLLYTIICITKQNSSIKILIKLVVIPARFDLEVESLGLPVDGGDGPGDADAEEDVDGVGARHVAHRVVRGLVTDGGHLGGEGV